MKPYWKSLMIKLGICHGEKVMYIGGSDVLPPPLKPEEEGRCMEALSRGELWAKQTLIERNLRLVVYIARRFENTGVNIEDLISIGTIGLSKGIESFDPSKGARLATYAARCVENEILMYFRSLKKSSGDLSLSDSIDTDKDGNALSLMDTVSSDEDLLESISAKETREQLLRYVAQTLTKREQHIISLRYGLGGGKPKTQRETAEICGISRSYVSRIEKRALEKLRQVLEG